MLQGMARGKVGDVVFSRNNGEQISRVRNRHPKNPRTNKQMYQRAVMATVMQAYAAGQEIFNHSFQGKSVGAENQRAFLSKNSKLLRGLLAAEIEANTAALNCNVAVVAPGAITPVPNEYMISEGAYPLNFFDFDDANKVFKAPTPTEAETVAQYANRNGLVAGDLYTFTFILVTSSAPTFSVRGIVPPVVNGLNPASQYPAIFGFVRLQVKDVASVATLASDANLGTFFEVSLSKNSDFDIAQVLLTDNIDIATIAGSIATLYAGAGLGSLGVVRSRLDQDLRSSSFMHVMAKSEIRASEGMYGITSPYALAAWQQGTEALGDSDLILEGGDENDFVRA